MASTRVAPIDMKLEVVVLGVADVDRAKAFYVNLGWRLDADFATGDGWRVVQVTPHNSQASVIFGKGIASPVPGSAAGLILAVDDVDAARADLLARGVGVSEVFHYPGGVFRAGEGAARQRARPARPFLLLVRLVRGPRRQRLAAPGDPDAAPRTRVGINAARGRGRRRPRGAPPRDG